MDPILQLRMMIEALRVDLDANDFDGRKRELLALVASLNNGHRQLDPTSAHERLSRREREVMNRLLSGQRLKEIAALLDISVKTVTTHRSRLLRKLGLEDNLGLYRYAVRNGLMGV